MFVFVFAPAFKTQETKCSSYHIYSVDHFKMRSLQVCNTLSASHFVE